MAVQTQSVLCRRLAEAYVEACRKGEDTITLHVNVLADILDYLNASDMTTGSVHKPFLDDQTDYTIQQFIALREKENGEIFGRDNRGTEGTPPISEEGR